METKSPATNRTDAKTLLQLGQRALAQLDIQARAAQIEAQRAELEFILEQARLGDVEALQEWLRVHGKSVDTGNKSGEIAKNGEATQDNIVESEIKADVSSWDDLRPFAMSRLRQRTHAIKSRSVAAEDVRADAAHLQQATVDSIVVRPTRSEVQDETFARKTAEVTSADGAALKTDEDEISLLGTSGSSELMNELDGELDDEFEDNLDDEREDESDDQTESMTQVIEGLDLAEPADGNVTSAKKPRRWRSIMVSAVFHVAILGALAAVTWRAPVKNGLLSLVSGENSADSEIDSFEVGEAQEMPQPDQPVEATGPTTESSLAGALTSFDGAISESLSQSLSAPGPQVGSLQDSGKSNVMAAKAGPSKNVMSFYGAESSGNSFCFVLDGSGSMRGGPWEAARIELLKSIGSLKPTQRFYIIFFNKEVMAITEPGTNQPASKPLAATPENLAHVKRWLDTLQIMTGEPPMKAMEAALEIECDCIYYLADGEMSDSVAKKLLEMLRKKNRVNDIIDGEVVVMPIHTIAYYSDKGLEIMRRLAEENRGQFAYVPKPNKPKSSR